MTKSSSAGVRASTADVREHQDRVLDPGRHRVDLSWLDVDLRNPRQVENLAGLQHFAVNVGEVVTGDPQVASRVLHAHQPLEAVLVARPNQAVQPGRALQRVERLLIRGVLVGLRSKPGQLLALHGGGYQSGDLPLATLYASSADQIATAR